MKYEDWQVFISYTIVSRVQGVDAECPRSTLGEGIREAAAGLSLHIVLLTDRFSPQK